MMRLVKHCSAAAAAVLAGSLFIATPTVASAASSRKAVTSSRTFHKMSAVTKDLFQESTSSTVDSNSNWGGVETLNVPQTQSQAQKDAAAAQKAAADQAAAAQAASRSSDRPALSPSAQPGQAPVDTHTNANVAVTPPDGTSASALISFALQFTDERYGDDGVPYQWGGTTPAGWDCSGFVQYIYAKFGVSLPRTSGEQAKAGRKVPDITQAMPGDILANGDHAAIYLAPGVIVNATKPGQGTEVNPISYFPGTPEIRRVL